MHEPNEQFIRDIARSHTPTMLATALLIACNRIADSHQEYHECVADLDWARRCLLAASDEKTLNQVVDDEVAAIESRKG